MKKIEFEPSYCTISIAALLGLFLFSSFIYFVLIWITIYLYNNLGVGISALWVVFVLTVIGFIENMRVGL